MTITYKTVPTELSVIDKVECNRCHASCLSMDNIEALGFHESWGYGSKKDCEVWSGLLCEKCSELFETWIESAGGKIDKEEVTAWGDPIGLDKEK